MMNRSTARISRVRAVLLVVGGTVGAVVLVELGVRLARDSLFTWQSKDSESFVTSDPMLGRLPKPGLVLHHPDGFTVSIAEHGTRSNGAAKPAAARPLTLVVGDSFAFGDGVDDADSWPAVLERLSGTRVVNAGMAGFGVDQAVLRAEQLAEVYAPDTIVLGFIPHDVLRCEMSYWSGHPKPYFVPDGSGLRLQPAPLTPRSRWDSLKWLIAWSEAVDVLFPTALHWEGPESVVAHRQGREVACRLMGRLAALGRKHRARVVVLAQAQQANASAEHLEIKDGLLACARENGLLTLDLFPVIAGLAPEKRAALFPRHMNVEGNRIVGTELMRTLAGRYSLD